MFYSINNYTKNITLANAHKMPKYMKLLKLIRDYNDHKICSTRRNLVNDLWSVDIGNNVSASYQNGPFTMLRSHGFVDIYREGHRVTWHITNKGRSFLASCE